MAPSRNVHNKLLEISGDRCVSKPPNLLPERHCARTLREEAATAASILPSESGGGIADAEELYFLNVLDIYGLSSIRVTRSLAIVDAFVDRRLDCWMTRIIELTSLDT